MSSIIDEEFKHNVLFENKNLLGLLFIGCNKKNYVEYFLETHCLNYNVQNIFTKAVLF